MFLVNLEEDWSHSGSKSAESETGVPPVSCNLLLSLLLEGNKVNRDCYDGYISYIYAWNLSIVQKFDRINLWWYLVPVHCIFSYFLTTGTFSRNQGFVGSFLWILSFLQQKQGAKQCFGRDILSPKTALRRRLNFGVGLSCMFSHVCVGTPASSPHCPKTCMLGWLVSLDWS